MGLFQAISRVVDGCEAQILEGAFTAGHLWMAGFFGAIVMLVLVAVLKDLAASRDPPP